MSLIIFSVVEWLTRSNSGIKSTCFRRYEAIWAAKDIIMQYIALSESYLLNLWSAERRRLGGSLGRLTFAFLGRSQKLRNEAMFGNSYFHQVRKIRHFLLVSIPSPSLLHFLWETALWQLGSCAVNAKLITVLLLLTNAFLSIQPTTLHFCNYSFGGWLLFDKTLKISLIDCCNHHLIHER